MVEEVLGQTRFLERFGRKSTLVCHVVDGENGLDILKKRVVCVHRLQVCRDKPALPIVAMDDVRLPAESLERFENPTAEKNEALVVVFVILFSFRALVETIPTEIVVVIEKVYLDLVFLVGDKRGLDVCGMCNGTDGNRNIFQADNIVEAEFPFTDESVPGHHDAYLVPQFFDRFREGAGDVGEAAGLCKRVYFTRNKENINRL